MAAPRCRDCGGRKWSTEGRCASCRAFPTLGFQVLQLVEAKCAIPDGEFAGDPYIPTDEQARLFLHYYRINPATGRFVYSRGAQYVRPQKHGKGPLSAAFVCAEADPDGPVLFDGWDADGQPVGKPWPTPWIQVTAVSEDQSANIWRALLPMIQLGSIRADMPDTGQTRINLPSGGLIEPVTASARSRLGQRITFAPQDEAHSWLDRNGGTRLADTQRRNLAGTGGRFLETGNAWDPRENSVAQKTAESGEPGVYHDDVEPGVGSVRNKAERRKMLKNVYGDSRWVDLERIDGEIVALLSRGEGAQAERFFLNRKLAGEDAAFSPKIIDSRKTTGEATKGALVVIGVDGARFEDALAIVATDVQTGFQWPLGIWERPEFADDDYEHPQAEVDGTMVEAFALYDVWRVYVDPQHIENLLEKWQGRWGEKRVLPWYTNRPRQMAWAVKNYTDALSTGDATHNGNPTLVAHLKNARRRLLDILDDSGRRMWALAKDRPGSPDKKDAADAAVLSWEARGDAIAAGAKPRREYRSAGFA